MHNHRTMTSAATSLGLMLLLIGCTAPSPPRTHQAATLPPWLDSYFEEYCDYTGSLGIGFVPWHTYDYRFRQHLKTTQDPELKRLFVLHELYRGVEFALDDFEKGMVRTGKSSSRPLTLPEWRSTQRSILAQIDDLAAYSAFTQFAGTSRGQLDPSNPSLDAYWIEQYRGRLSNVTNAPAANESLQPAATTP